MPDSGPKPIANLLGRLDLARGLQLETVPDDVPCVMWPVVAIENSIGEVARLKKIIDESDHLLGEIDCQQLAIDLESLSEAGLELADHLVKALNTVLDARSVLGRAIPEGDDDGA